MKRLMLLCFMVAFNVFCNAQDSLFSNLSDTSLLFIKVKSGEKKIKLKKNLEYGALEYDFVLENNEILFPYNIVNSDNFFDKNEYYAVYSFTDTGYIAVSDVALNDKVYKFLKYRGSEGMELRKKTAEYYGLCYLKIERDKLKKKYADYNRKGFVIIGKKYAFEKLTGRFGFDISYYNGYNKSIKYIRFTFVAYNRVGDITSDDIGNASVTAKVIGPIEPKKEGNVTFEKLFWDDRDIIYCALISKIEITFMDNTVKVITDVNNHLGDHVANSCK